MAMEVSTTRDPILPEELKAVLAINDGLNNAWDILDSFLTRDAAEAYSVNLINHNNEVFATISIRGVIFYPEDQK